MAIGSGITSTDTDSQSYLVSSIHCSNKKNDSDCKYIKQRVPELIPVNPLHIHTLFKFHIGSTIRCPRTRVDHTEESPLSKQIFKKLMN